jgi:peroxiredoxin
MIKMACVYFTIMMGVIVYSETAMAENRPPKVGDVLPGIVLTVPGNSLHQEYLGIETKGTFKIPQIVADIVIIEIFSMYCPHCQREAPIINDYYQKIQNDITLKDKVKMIGIGVGNSEFEVEFFRKKYNIQFPLFADADFNIHKMLGEVRTPYFIGIKIIDAHNHQVFYSQLGGPEDSRQFLEKILQIAGMK